VANRALLVSTDRVPTINDEARRGRWEDRADWPLTIAAVLFLVAYAIPILRPDLVTPWPVVCQLVTWATWALFGLDYIARLGLSRDRTAFMRGNLFDLAVVALPLLRPLRLLRLVTLLTVLNRNVGGSFRGRVAVYVAGATSLILLIASLAILNAERGVKGATITTFADATWWAFTTVTTVGYGDLYPVTGQGRFIAAGLMFTGIALLGIVTASLASWLIDKVREVEEHTQAATRADVVALAAEVHALREELRMKDSAI
jgi:voltage-gated potassium channel